MRLHLPMELHMESAPESDIEESVKFHFTNFNYTAYNTYLYGWKGNCI